VCLAIAFVLAAGDEVMRLPFTTAALDMATGQLVSSEPGTLCGSITDTSYNLVPHIALYQSLASTVVLYLPVRTWQTVGCNYDRV
jgi:hypothetical protein